MLFKKKQKTHAQSIHKPMKTQQEENEQPNLKNGQKTYCTPHQKRYIADKSYIISHKGNAILKTMRYHYIPVRMTKIQNVDRNKFSQACGATGPLIHCWWEYEMAQLLGRQCGSFL